MKKNNLQAHRGFTLIEIMVATSIFVVVMLTAVGSLTIVTDTARKSQALRAAMDNVSFAMEDMSRSLRTGANYTCFPAGTGITLGAGSTFAPTQNDCPIGVHSAGGGAIVFTPAGHSSTPDDTAFQRNQLVTGGPYTLQKCDTVNGCIDITSPAVNVETLKFFVAGSSTTDNQQPSVFIIMKGTVTVKGQVNAFAIQTLVSQRSTE